MNGDRRLTIIEHLEELRQRLIKSVIALAITTIVSFSFTSWLFRLLLVPAGGIKPIFTEVPEMLSTYMKVSLLSGVILAMPILVHQLVMFVAPALTPQEKRYLYLLLPGAMLSFLAGVLFGYFVLLPPALNFLLTFGEDIATPQIKIGNYVSVVTSLLFWIGLAFETPLVIFFLARLRVVTPAFLSKNRRYALVGAFILGAIITPTFDPVNQTLVAVPLAVLYEISILLAKLAWRGHLQPVSARA